MSLKNTVKLTFDVYSSILVALLLLVQVCRASDAPLALITDSEKAAVADAIKKAVNSDIIQVNFKDVNYDNGIVGVATVVFKDVRVPTIPASDVTVLIRRELHLCKWRRKDAEVRGSDHNRLLAGWTIHDPLAGKMIFSVSRIITIEGKESEVSVPDNMSVDETRTVLSFVKNDIDLAKIHEVKKVGGIVTLRTLEYYKGNVSAGGRVYDVELDETGKPVKFTKKGSWIS